MHKRVKEMAGAGLILVFIWIIWMILPKHKYAIVDTEAYRARQIDF